MIPVETTVALFPSGARVGDVRLHPPTICHAAAMEVFGIPFGSPIDPGNVYVAAWLLAMDADGVRGVMESMEDAPEALMEWCGTVNAPVSALVEAVSRLVETAAALYVPAGGNRQSLAPTGFGWMLEISEAIAHEYGMSLAKAMETPLASAFGMLACRMQRNGVKPGGPDYYERRMLRAAEDAAAKAKMEAEKKAAGPEKPKEATDGE